MTMTPTDNLDSSLIELAPNPYLDFGLRLGRDELYALGISAGATLLAGLLLNVFAPDWSFTGRAGILALVGPLAEKPGLFVHYVAEAMRSSRDADPARRRSLGQNLGRAFRAGWPSLRADLLYHDPVYTTLLWLMLRVSGTQSVIGAAMLSCAAFVTAVVAASALEVLSIDVMYRRLQRRLRRAGFVLKAYAEARFLVDPGHDPNDAPEPVLDRLQAHFCLHERTTYDYRDRYLTEHTLSVYNGRKPYIRFRQRCKADGTVSKQAVQVMYTRPREVRAREPGLYRCFVTRKEKSGYDLGLDQAMPWTIADIPDARVRRLVRRFSAPTPDQEIRFRRHVAMNPEGIFLSVDIPPPAPHAPGAYWLELKTRGSLDELRAISDYIAWKLPVRATTRSKGDPLADGDADPCEEQARSACCTGEKSTAGATSPLGATIPSAARG